MSGTTTKVECMCMNDQSTWMVMYEKDSDFDKIFSMYLCV